VGHLDHQLKLVADRGQAKAGFLPGVRLFLGVGLLHDSGWVVIVADKKRPEDEGNTSGL